MLSGAFSCPKMLFPQQSAMPSSCKPQENSSPVPIAMNVFPVGTWHCPSELSPQQRAVLLEASTPQLWWYPALTCRKGSSVGTRDWL